ncbi:MAG: hypothetical protein WC821_04145 [archaeon]|jgi:hypothetical protein
MVSGFSITPEQEKAFESILSNKDSVLASVSKESEKFNAFNALVGSQRVLTEIKTKISTNFSGQALVVCDPSNSKEVLLALTTFVKQSNQIPVLVLMNHNYKTILSDLKKAGVEDRVIIIDTVSKSIATVEETRELIFVDSLRNLTQLQIKMFNIMEKNHGCAFIFDSIAMLELYHEEEIVFKFIYSLTKILHKNNVNGFYISTTSESSGKLGQFFEETILLKKFLD